MHGQAFLWFATVSGLTRWGIRALWVELFPIKRHHTAPQGLLLMGQLLMLACVTLALVVGTIAPTYTAWGHQLYSVNTTMVQCTTEAPVSSNCTMTQLEQMSSVVRFKFAFFRYVLYWSTWVFLAAWLVCVFVAVCLRVRGSGDYDYDDGEVIDEYLDQQRPDKY